MLSLEYKIIWGFFLVLNIIGLKLILSALHKIAYEIATKR